MDTNERKRELYSVKVETSLFISHLKVAAYEQLEKWDNTDRNFNINDLIDLTSINWYKLSSARDLYLIYKELTKINTVWKMHKCDENHKNQLENIVNRIDNFRLKFNLR